MIELEPAQCKREGCVRPAKTAGWCTGHYQRVRKHGDPGPVEIEPRDGAAKAAAGEATETHCACGAPRAYKKYRQCHPCRERDRRRHPVGAIPESERFWGRVQHAEADECWIWTGWTSNGYGFFRRDDGKSVAAHRWAYEYYRAEIPDGLVIDHLCRVPACVNPWHLEPVTIAENSLRGEAPAIRTFRTGVCQRGHSMADAYVRPDTGARQCRGCIQLRKARQAQDPEFKARRAARVRAKRRAA